MQTRPTNDSFWWPWLARLIGIPLLAAIALVVMAGRALRLGRALCRPANGRVRLLIVGGFFNPNWFRSHILPLVAAESVEHVVVVTHEALFPVEKVTYDCPPAWLVRLTGRGIAKTLWFFRTARKYRPDVLMGYHIMPNSLACLVAAALFGGKAIYQMTGGPIQILGGGHEAEGGILRHLGRPSHIAEALLFHLVRQFDWVIVRGSRARDFLVNQRLAAHCAVITGSVDTELFSPGNGVRDYDIVYVSRLIPKYKGLEYFLDVTTKLAQKRPGLRVALVGDGPMLETLRQMAVEAGLRGNIAFLGKREETVPILRRARLFMLLSPSEGMSIAMLEAMSMGLPVVVTDVGDLRDMVEHGCNGFLVKENSPDEVACLVDKALDEPARLASLSRQARDTIVSRASVVAIARQWEALFAGTVCSHREGLLS